MEVSQPIELSNASWGPTPVLLLCVDWLLKKRASQIDAARRRVIETEDVAAKQTYIFRTSGWLRDLNLLLFLNSLFVAVSIGFVSIGILKSGLQNWIGHLLPVLAFLLAGNAGLKRLKLLQDHYLQLWRAGGISSIPGLIATLPETAYLDNSPRSVKRIELLNTLLQLPHAADLTGPQQTCKLDKYSAEGHRLSKNRTDFRTEVLLIQGLLRNQKINASLSSIQAENSHG